VKSALLLVLALLSLPAAAQTADTGFAGAAFGRAKSGLPCPPGDTCDDNASAWKLFFGGRFDENFGGEVSFIQTRDFERTASDHVSTRAFNLSVLAGIPLPRNSFLFGKLGVLLGHVEVGGISQDGWGPSFGVGGMIGLTRNLALRLDWDRYGFKMPSGGGERENIDMLTVGAQYVFGGR
jgi:hypothetical protein